MYFFQWKFSNFFLRESWEKDNTKYFKTHVQINQESKEAKSIIEFTRSQGKKWEMLDNLMLTKSSSTCFYLWYHCVNNMFSCLLCNTTNQSSLMVHFSKPVNSVSSFSLSPYFRILSGYLKVFDPAIKGLPRLLEFQLKK